MDLKNFIKKELTKLHTTTLLEEKKKTLKRELFYLNEVTNSSITRKVLYMLNDSGFDEFNFNNKKPYKISFEGEKTGLIEYKIITVFYDRIDYVVTFFVNFREGNDGYMEFKLENVTIQQTDSRYYVEPEILYSGTAEFEEFYHKRIKLRLEEIISNESEPEYEPTIDSEEV